MVRQLLVYIHRWLHKWSKKYKEHKKKHPICNRHKATHTPKLVWHWDKHEHWRTKTGWLPQNTKVRYKSLFCMYQVIWVQKWSKCYMCKQKQSAMLLGINAYFMLPPGRKRRRKINEKLTKIDKNHKIKWKQYLVIFSIS